MKKMKFFCLESSQQSGPYNMSFDEALLEYMRHQEEPLLIARVYGWKEPTLSIGVHQKERDLIALKHFYTQPAMLQLNTVRRPTGGRAILHDQDISYTLATNNTDILKKRLKTSYEEFSTILQSTLVALKLKVQTASAATEQDYIRSPICFETHTPSDLLDLEGQKLMGSAQLRRSGGLLQQGTLFLAHYGISPSNFATEFFYQLASHFEIPCMVCPEALQAQIELLRRDLEEKYLEKQYESSLI